MTRSEDGTAKLWDAATGENTASFNGDGSSITTVVWDDEHSQLFLSTANGGLFLYRYILEADKLVADACRRATRNLSSTEWQKYFPGQPHRRTCVNLPVHPSAAGERGGSE